MKTLLAAFLIAALALGPYAAPAAPLFFGQNVTASSASLPQPGSLIRQIDDTGIAGADGAALAAWTAVVGNPFAGTATVRSGTHGLNGLPVVEFNGITDQMASSQAGATPQVYTIGVIFKYLSTTGSQVLMNPDPVIVWVTGGSFNVNAGTGQNIATADTNWHKLFIIFNGASSKYSLDGGGLTAFAGTLGTGNYANALGNYEWLGAYNSAGSVAFPANVQVAGDYVWSADLTSSKAQWDAFTLVKWGL